jgi:predicted acetyltransferase
MVTSKDKSRSTIKTKIARLTSITKHRKTKKTNNIQLVHITSLTMNQLKQLANITSNKETMKHIGKGRIWSLKEIITYIDDEKKEIHKPEDRKSYYSFILLLNNHVIGYISGRKSGGIGIGYKNRFDLLLRMFIDSNQIGQGFGTRILKLFIKKYSSMIKTFLDKHKPHKPLPHHMNHTPIEISLFSDISLDNIPSLKIHQKNNFSYYKEIIYDGKTYQRYVRKLVI